MVEGFKPSLSNGTTAGLCSPTSIFLYRFWPIVHIYPRGERDIRDIGTLGQDKTVPELSDDIPYDPFKVDIYQLGHVFLKIVHVCFEFVPPTLSSTDFPFLFQPQQYKGGLNHFRDLATQMTRSKPEDRPSASKALEMFQDLIASLTERDLKRRIWSKHLSLTQRIRIKHFGAKPLDPPYI